MSCCSASAVEVPCRQTWATQCESTRPGALTGSRPRCARPVCRTSFSCTLLGGALQRTVGPYLWIPWTKNCCYYCWRTWCRLLQWTQMSYCDCHCCSGPWPRNLSLQWSSAFCGLFFFYFWTQIYNTGDVVCNTRDGLIDQLPSCSAPLNYSHPLNDTGQHLDKGTALQGGYGHDPQDGHIWRRRVNTNSQQLDNIICNHDSTLSQHTLHWFWSCTGQRVDRWIGALFTVSTLSLTYGNVINLPISHCPIDEGRRRTVVVHLQWICAVNCIIAQDLSSSRSLESTESRVNWLMVSLFIWLTGNWMESLSGLRLIHSI